MSSKRRRKKKARRKNAANHGRKLFGRAGADFIGGADGGGERIEHEGLGGLLFRAIDDGVRLDRPLDFVEAENSSGFHAPEEALRILGESINFARKGQLALRPLKTAANP